MPPTAREGLLALAVATGLQVMQVLMDEDVTRSRDRRGSGTRGAPRCVTAPTTARSRWAARVDRFADHVRGERDLGSRRLPTRRPRVRAADGSGELLVPSYELFSSTEILDRLAMERMLAELSCWRHPTGLEPVGAAVEAAASGTSKSAISRRFVAATERALAELMNADLTELDLSPR